MRIGTMLTALALALAALCLPACEGAQKYRLIFDGYGFESERTEYAAGEKVTVTYDLIATDTDYTFSIDGGVQWERDYDNAHGYVFRFTMPARDVTISVESHSSMTIDPLANPMPAFLSGEALLAGIEGEDPVFDWLRSSAATVGGGEYMEYALYARQEGSFGGGLVLVRRARSGNGPLREGACVVPERVLDECLAAVDLNGMRDREEGAGIFGGASYAVRWKDGDAVTQISSDRMPEDGEKTFGAIAAILGDAWSRYAPPEEPDPAADGGGTTDGAEPRGSGRVPDHEGLREGEWFCPDCGMKNGGKYCSECGRKCPEPDGDEG